MVTTKTPRIGTRPAGTPTKRIDAAPVADATPRVADDPAASVTARLTGAAAQSITKRTAETPSAYATPRIGAAVAPTGPFSLLLEHGTGNLAFEDGSSLLLE
jgi:hypothetical protein